VKRETRLDIAGVEPDSLAGFTASLFLPLDGVEVTLFYDILSVSKKQGDKRTKTNPLYPVELHS